MVVRTKTKQDLTNEVTSSLKQIIKSAKRSLRAELEEVGLTVPQAMVLHSWPPPMSGCRHANWDVSATCSHPP